MQNASHLLQNEALHSKYHNTSQKQTFVIHFKHLCHNMDIHIVIQNLLSFVPMYISCLKLKVIDRDVEKFTVNTKAPNFFFFFTVSIYSTV